VLDRVISCTNCILDLTQCVGQSNKLYKLSLSNTLCQVQNTICTAYYSVQHIVSSPKYNLYSLLLCPTHCVKSKIQFVQLITLSNSLCQVPNTICTAYYSVQHNVLDRVISCTNCILDLTQCVGQSNKLYKLYFGLDTMCWTE
jgi:hypothetical protein